MANDELKAIVQRMMDDGQSQENIGAVIRAYNERKPAQFNPNPPPLAPTNEPTTFAGGVMKSIMPQGSAWDAAEQGGRGYVKGAILDLPGSIMGGLQSIGGALMDPVGTAKSVTRLPSAIGRGLQSVAQTTMEAGAKPFEFGEMMGQTTGQPLATEGLIKGAPGAYRLTGSGLESAGGVMRRHQPITGLFPSLIVGRTPRTIEKWMGGRIEDIGRRMANPVLEGELVNPDIFAPPTPSRTALPPSNTTYQDSGPLRRLLTGETTFDSQSPSPMHGTSDIFTPPPPRVRGNPVTPSTGETIPLGESSLTKPQPLNMTSAPLGQVVTIKQKFITPEIVEQFKSNGFSFDSMDNAGGFKFKKTSQVGSTPVDNPREYTRSSPAPTTELAGNPPINKQLQNLIDAGKKSPYAVQRMIDIAAESRLRISGLDDAGNPVFARELLPEKTPTPVTKTVSSTPASRAANDVSEMRRWGDWEDYRMKEIEAGRNDPGMWDGKSSVPTTGEGPLQIIQNSLQKNQTPKIKVVAEGPNNNRIWINDIEHTKYWGPGGPTNAEIQSLHARIRDPKSFARLGELQKNSPPPPQPMKSINAKPIPLTPELIKSYENYRDIIIKKGGNPLSYEEFVKGVTNPQRRK